MRVDEYNRLIKQKKIKKSKYRNIKIKYDGITFDSKKEALYYKKLLNQERQGEIKLIQRQVAFPYCIYVSKDINSDVKYLSNQKYIADFVVTNNDGSEEIIDVKGYKTKEYKFKKRIIEMLYDKKIKEVN